MITKFTLKHYKHAVSDFTAYTQYFQLHAKFGWIQLTHRKQEHIISRIEYTHFHNIA